jgi:hypothetical protein
VPVRGARDPVTVSNPRNRTVDEKIVRLLEEANRLAKKGRAKQAQRKLDEVFRLRVLENRREEPWIFSTGEAPSTAPKPTT